MLHKKTTASILLIPILIITILLGNHNTIVHAEGNTSEKTVYTTDSLEKAIETLSESIEEVKTANSSLEEKITSYKTYITDTNDAKYTPNSYNAFKEELVKAETLKNQTDKKITSASEVLTSIKTEYEAVKKKNREESESSDNSDENPESGEIPEDTLKGLQQKAETALTNLASEEECTAITTKINSLQTYANALLVRADKSTLTASIEKAKAKNKNNYFSEEYEAMMAVIPEVTKVLDDPNATKAEVTAANKKMNSAISALRVIYTTSGNTRIYNIINFGADGNDSVDDAAAIQTALDLASESYKIEINFPNGTYYLSKVLYIQSNTTLKLSSGTVIFRMDSALGSNMLKCTDSKHKTSTGAYDLAHDIIVDGGTWNGGNISKSTKECNLLYFGHCNGLTVSNATIKNCYGSHALEMAGVSNATIEKCTFTDFRYGSNSYTSEAIQMDICWKSSSEGDWAPGYKQDKTTCKNIVIRNNTIIDYPRGIGSHHYLSGHQYSNITIQNNTIKRSSASTQGKCVTGVFLVGVKNTTVKSNTVNSYYYGIWIKLSSGLTVKSNKLKYNAYYNILYDGNNVANKQVRFTFVEVKDKKVGAAKSPAKKQKKLYYTAPTMKKGYLKTGGKKYSFKKSKKYFTVKLKKKLKKNQKIEMYGTDKDSNKFYKIYYAK